MRITILQALLAVLSISAIALAATAESPEPAAGEPILISQKNKVFDPGDLTIKQGETVMFRNDDRVTHNVFSRTKGSQFNLKMQKPDQEDLVTFEEAGDVIVRCAIHPTMQLTIHVEEASDELAGN